MNPIMTWPTLKPHFDLTIDLMNECKIPIRDTWNSNDKEHADDFYTNGNQWHGPRQIKLVYTNSCPFSRIVSGKVYVFDERKHLAHDGRVIEVNERYVGIKHPIVHEIVHYLQVDTIPGDHYIDYNGHNFEEYYSQRKELEAHFAQIACIGKHERYLLSSLNQKQVMEFDNLLQSAKITQKSSVLKLIKFMHDHHII